MKQRKRNVIKEYQNVKAFRVKRMRISLENKQTGWEELLCR